MYSDNSDDHKKPLYREDEDSVSNAHEPLLHYLMTEMVAEQKRRRWGDWIFRGFILLGIGGSILVSFSLVALLSVGLSEEIGGEASALSDKKSNHVAFVEFNGVLDASLDNHTNTMAGLKKAFASKQVQGVILKINSPGGSPVVADEMYQDIRALRQKHPDKKLMVVTGDVCASGGYYLAVSGDKIFVNASSIVGSIGVIHMSFGVQKLFHNINIEPRIITSGDRKALLNPFEPIKPEDKAHLDTMLKDIHERFIAVVREGRGDRLKENNVFNGLFWTGDRAIKMGLVDGLGTVQSVAMSEFNTDKIIDYSIKKLDIEKWLGIESASLMPTLIRHLGLWQTQGQFQ